MRVQKGGRESRVRRNWFGLLVCLAVPLPVVAATFVVTTVNDLPDAVPGDGICLAAGANACTLRAAVQETNALPGEDRIQLPSLQPRFRLLIAGTGQEDAATGDLDITDDVVIEGIGPGVATIDANLLDRVFDIFPPARVVIRNLVLQAGRVNAAGGGIRNGSILRIEGVTVQNNSVDTGAGGGVANLPGGQLTVVNSTFFNNNAATLGQGGGLANLTDAVARLESVTFLNNVANAGGALHNLGEVQVHNSIFAGSALGGNCAGIPALSLGYNLDTGTTCLFDRDTDQNSADPRLLVPAFHGGLSLTAALQAGSAAIDRGDPVDCPTVDQRGFSRPADGDGDGIARCDVGAFEVNPPTPTPTITGTFTPRLPTATPSPTTAPAPPSPTETPNLPGVSPTSTLLASPTATPSACATPTRDASPTPTPEASATASASPSLFVPRLEVNSVAGFSGQSVDFTVFLAATSRPVVAAQAVVNFDAHFTPVQPLPDGSPDCRANRALEKSFLAQFQPAGCVGDQCRAVRAFLFSDEPDLTAIPVGSPLWSCTVQIAADAPLGAYALTLTDPLLVDHEGEELEDVQGVHGAIVVLATPTPTVTASSTPTRTSSPTATASATTVPGCAGDCNDDRAVTVDELVLLVNVALGREPLEVCPTGDLDGDGSLTVNEIIVAVLSALEGCGEPQIR